ncbi:hypothetical protein CHUAL_000550 [Chamberlinius hualienensis]
MEDEEYMFSHSGLVARSPEGHAAKGMNIKGDENAWIEIQQNTFTNWVNEQLRHVGLSVEDLQRDFYDGVKLIALVEVLQKKKVGRKIAKPINQHQYLENVQTALNAISADGVKLVNIGNIDIVEGNLKLILGLIWSLILRYQIGRTKFPPKKFMLSWLQSVLPDCQVSNFTKDWNSGKNLSALLDYCKPGLFPHWNRLNPRDGVNNCRNAMTIAMEEFNIPMILQPEYLANPNLDELSGMTYLSYFMKEDSPGYVATLNWVRKQIPDKNVKNFTSDWNDGINLASLVRSLGASVHGYNQMNSDQSNWEQNIQAAMDAGHRLGVSSLLKAKTMADPEVEHLGPMAYVSQFQWVRPRARPSEKIQVSTETSSARINQPVNFKISYNGTDINPKEITVDIKGPSNKVKHQLNFSKHNGLGTFVPYEVGMHELLVCYEGEEVANCPINIRVLPDLSRIMFSGIDPCALGSIVEVLINSNGVGGGVLEVEAYAPSGRSAFLPVSEEDGVYATTFQPNEAGEWKIGITYEGEPINGSPFTCYCFDPHRVKLIGLEGAVMGHLFHFTCDTSEAGWGDVKLDIVHNGKSVTHKMEDIGEGLYNVKFTPVHDGKYKIYVYFNGTEIKNSPYRLRVRPTFDPLTVTASGEGLKSAQVGQQTNYVITCRGAGHTDVDVKIYAPSRKSLSYRLKDKRNGVIVVEFTPQDVGDHTIETQVKGFAVKGSPFHCAVFDPRKVNVGRISDGHIGKPVQFEVDTSQAGQGVVEICVNNGQVTSNVKNVGNYKYAASFVPHKASTYAVDVKFNGMNVPGSPFKIGVHDTSADNVRVSGDALVAFQAGKAAFLKVKAPGFVKEEIKMNILSPTNKTIAHRYVEERGNDYTFEFIAYEVGPYTIDVFVSAKKVPGSPFMTKAYDPSLIKLSDVPNGVVGQQCSFEVDASQAGEGELEISINDGEVPNQVEVVGAGKCLVYFTPEEPIVHIIDIAFNGNPVPGCPLRCRVGEFSRASVDLRQLDLIPINKPARFDVDVGGGVEAELEVVVTAPSRIEVPVKINGSARNGYVVEFIPREVGSHVIHAYYGSSEVLGTPYTLRVFDYLKVEVGEIPLGMVGKPTQFVVDAGNAGEGNLEIVVSHQGQHVPTEVRPLGGVKFEVSFVPEEPFDHIINVTFNKEPVNGSPFRAKVQDVSRVASKITSNITSSLSAVAINRAASFNVQGVSGMKADDISVRIDGPQGYPVYAQVYEQGSDTVKVDFTPPVTGEYKVHVSFLGVAIPGNPFVCRVYDICQIKVKDIPDAVVGKPATIIVETAQAGPGNLEVTVNNGQVPSSAQAHSKHALAITFTPREAKPHIIDIRFNGEAAEGSPFTCLVSDIRKVMVSGEGLEKVPVGRPAVFSVDTQDDVGYRPEIKITGPLQRTIPAYLTNPRRGVYLSTYTPVDVGDHFVEVQMNNLSLPGSPFLVKAYDASKVIVSDITKGFVKKPVYFSIDASQAGAGNLEIIVSVNNRNVPNYVQSEGNAKFRVNFRPQEAQDHLLSIKFNGEHVPGSPFKCTILDGNQCVVSEAALNRCAISKTVNFTIDTKESDVSIKVSVSSPNGRSLPTRIVSLADGKYQVDFTPNEVGPHLVHVSTNGEPIQGSPFTCNVYDVSKIKIANLRAVAVGRPSTFQVDASQAGEGTLELVITNQKSSVRAEVSAKSRGLYDVTFSPTEPIAHFVNISFNDEDIPGSPFLCDAHEETNGHSSNWEMKSSKKHYNQLESHQFDYHHKENGGVDEVDVAPSRGKLNTKTSKQSEELNIDSSENGGWNFSTKTREHHSDSGAHSLDRRTINRYEKTESLSVTARGGGLSSKQVVVGTAASFDMDTKGMDDDDVQINIIGPDGKPIYTKVTRVRNGVFRIEYTPHKAGSYSIEAFHGNTALFRKPFVVEVVDPSKVVVSGIQDGFLGKELAFNVDTAKSGKGLLTASIRTAGQEVKYHIVDLPGNNHRISFTPKTATLHKIDIRYNGHKVSGYPREVNIKDPSAGTVILASGLGLHQAKIHKSSSFVIETLKYEAKDFDVIITGPGDSLVPLRCYQQKDGNLLAEFTPYQVGAHYIEVLYKGKAITGSPFVCQVYNPSKVSIDKMALTTHSINDKISFKLNRKEAGYAELDVTVTSPLGRDLPIDVRSLSDGFGEIIEFIPTVPGKYKIAITYGGEEINGSPLIFMVEDEGVARVYGDGVNVGQQDSPVTFKIDGRGLRGEPHVKVDGPETVASCSIEEQEDGIFIVTYTPKEVGIFDVRVFWNNKEVPGSPFHPKVVNTKKVRIIGGWDSLLDGQNRMALVSGEEMNLSFDVSEAGTGKLTAEVRGPKGLLHSSVKQTGNSRYKLSFIPVDEGEHLLYLYYSGLHLPHSPILAYAEVIGNEIDAAKVILQGRGLAVAHVDEEAEFTIDGTDAGPGIPEVTFSGSKTDVNVKVEPLGNCVYKVTYTPLVPAYYLMTVLWSGKSVKGCPVKINVVTVANANRVICAGDGLQGGVVGKELKTFIDTRKAGSGELTAHCMGPNKTAHCDLYDHEDGTFTLFIKPHEPGRHYLTIKYAGEHIPGSPYTIRVAGAPDASKVRVYGPGIEHGVLATYQSRFICETRGAGAGQLTVRIRGPKGAFRVEMQRETQKDRTILCKYDPTEPGDYRIEVKWSGQHVQGSPFSVMIFDTVAELNRYKQGLLSATPGMNEFSANGTYSTAYGQVTFGQPSWKGSQQQL